MNIQPRRLAPARLPHFRPDTQPLPTGEGRGGGGKPRKRTTCLAGLTIRTHVGGVMVSGRCNSPGQRPLAVGAAQASLLPRSAHVAVKPGPSHTPDQDIII